MEDQTQTRKPIIGISIGDINGVGPEVVMKALLNPRILNFLTPVIYGSSKIFNFYKKNLGLDNFNFQQIPEASKANHKKINLINIWNDPIEISPGKEDKDLGRFTRMSLQKVIEDVKNGSIQGMVTAPLSKDLVQAEDFQFPGHTEYLAEMAGKKEHLMFLVDDLLRVGVVTGHVPFSKVPELITKEAIARKLKIMIHSLQLDFGIKKPKIAVLGLNPHAGENGLLGNEEKEIIAPVINEFKSSHHLVYGPFSSDGFFGQGLYKKYDGVLAMYHDQGLIPFKTLAFNSGVNFTAGLPFIRTSPDHGTAFQIAGKNEADESSLRNALYLSKDIAINRMNN